MKTFINVRRALFAGPLVSAAILGAEVQTAHAQSLFSEGFDYTSGNGLANAVNPGNNTAWTGGNNSELQIGASQLSYPGLQELTGTELVYTSSGSASTSYNTYTAVTSGSIYYSFLINCTTLPTANEYVTALDPGVATPSGSGDSMALYVGASGTGWKIGVRTTGGGTGAVFSSGALALNQTYLVVGELTLGSSPVASVFVDPTPGASQPAANASQSTATAINSVDDVGFKVQSVASTGNFDIGNLLIGTDWADVTPASVPEPGTFALVGGGAMLFQLAWRRRLQRA
jgi:hypothetical protein